MNYLAVGWVNFLAVPPSAWVNYLAVRWVNFLAEQGLKWVNCLAVYNRPIRVERPGTAVRVFLLAMWLLALVSWGIGMSGYAIIMFQHYGPFTATT